MGTIRRLYVYLVTFISLEVVLWGLIGLGRSILAKNDFGGVNQLASALSLLLVGVPVFLLHWWLSQKTIGDPEERFARLRAIFIYGAILSTAIPVVQNILALLNRLWLTGMGVSTRMAFIGEGQNWIDNLIAIIMNGILYAYFVSVERKDWAAQPHHEAYPETRRLFRYIWVIYSIGLVTVGVQQVIHYIFNLAEVIGESARSEFANGVALLIIGAPLWAFTWQKIVQKSLTQRTEKQSTLRIFILYVLSLVGVGGVLVPTGMIFHTIFQAVLGETITWQNFLTTLSGPLSAAIPFGMIWGYYGKVLSVEVAALPPTPRRAALQRLYNYILAAVGLGATIIGLQMLLTFITDSLIGQYQWGYTLRNQLSAALATLLVGLPLWVKTWRPLLHEAAQEGDDGDHARRSVIRKAYLYLALFTGVIGVMVSAGSLIFQLLSAALGDPFPNFQRTGVILFETLLLFAGLLSYHWLMLNGDTKKAAASLSARHAQFNTIIFQTANDPLGDQLKAALLREMPALPVEMMPATDPAEPKAWQTAQAVIVPAECLASSSEDFRRQLENFDGYKIVVPTPLTGWVWIAGSAKSVSDLMLETVGVIQKLAEGAAIGQSRPVAGWMGLVYILGGLVGLPLLISLFSLLAELLY